jgi:hypothetical protein
VRFRTKLDLRKTSSGVVYGFIVQNARVGTHADSQSRSSNMKKITKDQFSALLDKAGISGTQKHRLHALFEQQYPEAHQGFLEYLAVPAEEIRAIRQKSKES